MLKELFRLVALIVVLQQLTSCAIQSGGPEGGPEDVDAPLISAENPPNLTTGFSRKEIIISFDEFIKLNNPQQEIIITPAPAIPPTYIAKKRSVHVDLSKVELLPNTTYNIQFGNAIIDNNAGNAYRNYQYIFSTGDYIDSLTLAGRVGDALSLQWSNRVKVILHKPGNDSAIIKANPQYYAYTNESGNFSLNYLPPDTYAVYALDDKNGNYTLDEGEPVGFLDSAVYLDHNIKLATPILISPAKLRRFMVTGYSVSPYKIGLGFNYPVDSFQLGAGQSSYTSFDQERDSVNIWPKQPFDQIDSMRLIAYSSSRIVDTLLRKRKQDTLLLQPLKINFEGGFSVFNKYGTPLIANFNQPLKTVNLDSIVLMADSLQVQLDSVEFLTDSKTKAAFRHNFKAGINYMLQANPGAFVSMYDSTNKDTLRTGFSKPRIEDFAYLEIAVSLPDTAPYIFQLIKGDSEVFYEEALNSSQKVAVPYASPGSYKMRLIRDENYNGRWDGGNVLQKKQPEAVYFYPDAITVKANWELLDLKFAPELQLVD